MRRNLGTEVLIAVGAVSIIVCGLFFALLLSTTSEDPTATPFPSSAVTTIVQSNTGDVSTPEEDEVTATDTDVPEPTATDTDEASETPEDEPTDTDEPTETSSKPTPIEEDTDEPTDEPTVTDSPEPTATDTDEPTDTPEPTATEEDEATKTPEPTETSRPTDEPEPTATVNNAEPPTATSVSGYVGIIPTLPPSPTVAPLNEPTRTPSSCDLPRGWTTYTVQPGDTLFAISLVTNSTVDELRFANCIDDIDNITAGEQVYVPIAPVRPVSTTVPSGIRQGLVAVGCTSPSTQITSPITAQRVSGTFTLYGTATRPDFQYYKIEVRPDFADIYNFYSDSQTQVVNGVLGQINADLFGPGLHWVRLSVVDLRAEIPADAICEIPMIFE